MERKKLICLDFDGVLHSYASGWKGATEIPDPPVHGAMEWLKDVLEDDRFDVAIYSSRNGEDGGIQAMQKWLTNEWGKRFSEGQAWGYVLMKDGSSCPVVNMIQWPTAKPPAYITIDDRAWQFRGVFPALGAIDTFTPWNKDKGTTVVADVFVASDGQVRVWL